jgi:predicted AlkP superfamily phosphohydrolase/phosphomutase
MRTLTVVSRLLAATLLIAACSGSKEQPQVLIFAVDGLEPTVLERMLELGRMPNTQRLVDRGSLARIKCVTTMLSPVVWTTTATGMSPEEHGITDFHLDGVPVRSSDRRRPAFWNMLGDTEVSTATVGWMVSWPAEDSSGIVISDRAHYGNFERKTVPTDVLDLSQLQVRPAKFDQLERFTGFQYNPAYQQLDRDDPAFASNFLVDRRLRRIAARDEVFTRAAEQLLVAQDPDLLALYLRGIDYVSHGFWQFYEPEPFRREGWKIEDRLVEELGTVIPSYYEYLDEILGRILRAARPETLVLLLSDHGFGSGLGSYASASGDFLSGNHRSFGVLLISGEGAQRGVTQSRQITHYDLLPTLLWILGQPQADDFQGRPLIEYFSDDLAPRPQPPSIASYGRTDATLAEEAPTEEDEAILDELRSLGYVD